MVPRELLLLLPLAATLMLLTTLSVATAAVASASIAGDYDATEEDVATGDNLQPDQSNSSNNGNDKPSNDDDHGNNRNNNNSNNNRNGSNKNAHHNSQREVRCYCNQPHCVSQGYMCRGRGCFTELPLTPRQQQLIAQLGGRAEHAAYSGCLERSFAERPCPPGKLCCEQDLCNHVDSPAMRNRLNKTLQVLLGEHTAYFGSVQPAGQEEVQTSDGWFRTATIAVPICGFVVLLVLASLAIRLLQPLPSQGDKLNGLRIPESAPPLLGPPSKLPLV